MDYIENTLVLKVRYQPRSHTNELPYYLLGRYDFQQTTLDSVKTFFLYLNFYSVSNLCYLLFSTTSLN